LKVPRRKWVVWYLFWIVLASLVTFQIFTMKHILSVQPAVLDFGSDARAMNIVIANNGTGVIKWEIESNLSWIGFEPASGGVSTEKDIVKVTVNRSMVDVGTTTGKFAVVGRKGEKAIVEVRVKKQG